MSVLIIENILNDLININISDLSIADIKQDSIILYINNNSVEFEIIDYIKVVDEFIHVIVIRIHNLIYKDSMLSYIINSKLTIKLYSKLYLLTLSKTLKLANSINNLPIELKDVLYHNLGSEAYDTFVEINSQINKISEASTIFVCTYASYPGGWFPYFYSHYSEIVGSDSIYVFTPCPEEFLEYKLGGVIKVPTILFDNTNREFMMSSFFNGLLSYYRYGIMCDVDELIAPNPLSGHSFLELLDILNQDSITPIGIDVVNYAEQKIDLTKKITDQLVVGILNKFLFKTSISRKNIRYSPGFHTSSAKPCFLNFPNNFICYHLKYSNEIIRKEICNSLNKITYYSDVTKQYQLKTALAQKHPHFDLIGSNPPVSLNSTEVISYCKNLLGFFRYNVYEKRYEYDTNNIYSNFFVMCNE